MDAEDRIMTDFASDDYFDANKDRQLKPFPKKWMDASRFKVGDKIEFLRYTRIHIPCEECVAKSSYFHYNNANADRCENRSMKGMIGTVTEVHNGYGEFPDRWVSDDGPEGGFYAGQHAGRVVVQFPVSAYKKKDGSYGPVACSLDGEGRYWRKVK